MDPDPSWYNTLYSTWAALTSGKLTNDRRLDKHLKACKSEDSYSFNRLNRLLAVNFDQQLLSDLACNKKIQIICTLGKLRC